MTKDGKKPPQEEPEGTRVDLGEDLLDKSEAETGGDVYPLGTSNEKLGAADFLQNARILLNEGLQEEAKKVLRSILVKDSGDVAARKLLNEIHESELQQLFGTESPRRPSLGGARDGLGQIDPERLLEALDRDLGLGLAGQRPPLFADEAAAERYSDALEALMSDASARDRVDLGIGFLEMDLPEVAIRQFQAAYRLLTVGEHAAEEDDPGLDVIGVTCLLSYALILADRAFEAIECILPAAEDQEIQVERKIELFYLLGRAKEKTGKRDEATLWYRRVLELDPHYRDVEERARARR